MITNRTFFGCVGAGIDIPAVEADPSGFHIRNEELVLLHKLGEFTKTITMSFSMAEIIWKEAATLSKPSSLALSPNTL